MSEDGGIREHPCQKVQGGLQEPGVGDGRDGVPSAGRIEALPECHHGQVRPLHRQLQHIQTQRPAAHNRGFEECNMPEQRLASAAPFGQGSNLYHGCLQRRSEGERNGPFDVQGWKVH